MSRKNVPKMSSVFVAILINTSLANGHRIGAVIAVAYRFTQLIIRVGFMDQLLFLSLSQQCQSRCRSATMCYSIICCSITAHCKTTSPLLYYFSSKTVEQCEIGPLRDMIQLHRPLTMCFILSRLLVYFLCQFMCRC